LGRSTKAGDADLSGTLVSLLMPVGKLLLDGGLGIADLLGAGKEALVRAAIADVMQSTVRINVSRLSVMTGLTRKEVAAILNKIKGIKTDRHVELKKQRALRVLQGWRVDSRFRNKNGRPSILSLRGDERSFASLVKIYGGDVTPNSVLRELERMNAVTSGRFQQVRFRHLRVHAKSVGKMADLARLFPDFAQTVSSQHSEAERPPFFGFKESFVDSPIQAARFQRTFSNRATILLQSVEQWAGSQNKARKRKSGTQTDKYRVGIGVYLVQGDARPNRKSKARA